MEVFNDFLKGRRLITVSYLIEAQYSMSFLLFNDILKRKGEPSGSSYLRVHATLLDMIVGLLKETMFITRNNWHMCHSSNHGIIIIYNNSNFWACIFSKHFIHISQFILFRFSKLLRKFFPVLNSSLVHSWQSLTNSPQQTRNISFLNWRFNRTTFVWLQIWHNIL